MRVRAAAQSDSNDILRIEREAFGGQSEAELVTALLQDESAQPVINLVAENKGALVGHVLFTHAAVDTNDHVVDATILAPLAVVPSAQRQGVGQALCREGIGIARERGIGLVFVLGHIDYYPRLGFTPAAPFGLTAPYPIEPAVADAWMVLETRPGLLGTVQGVVRCADALMHPEMWAE